MPDLSIVIVTHNGRELALTTLESALSHVGDLSVEWVIVDSGSSDGTPEAIEERWPDISVTRLDNVGFAVANNVGFAASRGRYVLALNPDTEVRWGRFDALVAAMDADPRDRRRERHPGGERRQLPEHPPRPDGVARARRGALAAQAARSRGVAGARARSSRRTTRSRPQTGSSARSLLIRRAALADVGGFDERFFMYSEEADLCRRIRDAGWTVRHLPVMRILHHGGKPNPRLAAQQTFSRLEYASKHFGPLRAASYRAVLAVHHLLRLGLYALGRAAESAAPSSAARSWSSSASRRRPFRRRGPG